jgi:hypothetical protein
VKRETWRIGATRGGCAGLKLKLPVTVRDLLLLAGFFVSPDLDLEERGPRAGLQEPWEALEK